VFSICLVHQHWNCFPHPARIIRSRNLSCIKQDHYPVKDFSESLPLTTFEDAVRKNAEHSRTARQRQTKEKDIEAKVKGATDTHQIGNALSFRASPSHPLLIGNAPASYFWAT